MATSARRLHKVIWPHRDGKLTCPVCMNAILLHDPVYVGLSENGPVHEWCAWTEKQRLDKVQEGVTDE